ncbi:MAG: hypothetical protein NTY36_13930 [Deltaproteobacteria bacterium]|nr:hypothetical protein [Deltaproteobacteria bacterium]
MGFFSRSYEPGGVHHLRITDSVFEEAQELIRTDEELRKHFKEVAQDEGCAKYEAHDFPVTEILGNFMLTYELQEEKSGVPENLRLGNIRLGRKDQVEYEKFVARQNQRIQSKIERKEAAWAEKGFGGKLFSVATSLAAEGIKRAATGKSQDTRMFEKDFTDYICGASPKAKEYLLKFAHEFGADDEGVIAVAQAIRTHFAIAEFAKYNRSK